MAVEIKGQQLRIRLKQPEKFKTFRTHDVGGPGKLQRIAGKKGGEWDTQAWHLNLEDYESKEEVMKSIDELNIGEDEKSEAKKLARQWWEEHHGASQETAAITR